MTKQFPIEKKSDTSTNSTDSSTKSKQTRSTFFSTAARPPLSCKIQAKHTNFHDDENRGPKPGPAC